ncbi:plasmid mobilization protein [Chitinophaga cymbidii]|uniref:Uncharacterized protein n=1 Tax=Chitinophaga cymbidii TaxID=1096750 RepID=A0A512RFV6_9BACT|nr:plasmid mobilization relaxosome protein MobC [Chitinophaga cymbidii]GEP94534.1 hypothetical protein CCY01nite_07940 [Chitinophaga cymbidii]
MKTKERLEYPIMTRINKRAYDQLHGLLQQTRDETLAGLVRTIIHNRPVKTYIHDETMELVLEELASLRAEIKAIGVNINQITRYFNTYPEEERKRFYAKIGLARYIKMESKVDKAISLISKLSKSCLSK